MGNLFIAICVSYMAIITCEGKLAIGRGGGKAYREGGHGNS